MNLDSGVCLEVWSSVRVAVATYGTGGAGVADLVGVQLRYGMGWGCNFSRTVGGGGGIECTVNFCPRNMNK